MSNNLLVVAFLAEDEKVGLKVQCGDTEYLVNPQEQLILNLSYGSNTLTVTTASQIGSNSRVYTFLITVS